MSKSGAVYFKNRKLRRENASLVRAGRKIVAERDALEMAYNEAADRADSLDGQVEHLLEVNTGILEEVERSRKIARQTVGDMHKAQQEAITELRACQEELRASQLQVWKQRYLGRATMAGWLFFAALAAFNIGASFAN